MGWIQEKIKEWKDSKKVPREEREAYERARRIEEDFQNKRMSSNERELRRYEKEAREREIKRRLEMHRKAENQKVWSGRSGNPLYAKNIMRDNKKLFSSGNMFAQTNNILKTRNIIKGGKQ